VHPCSNNETVSSYFECALEVLALHYVPPTLAPITTFSPGKPPFSCWSSEVGAR
jgi:hypothetical protein